jgi:hypothetical protein
VRRECGRPLFLTAKKTLFAARMRVNSGSEIR